MYVLITLISLIEIEKWIEVSTLEWLLTLFYTFFTPLSPNVSKPFYASHGYPINMIPLLMN